MRPGDLIDGFELAELAGSGGMARVYRARERHSGLAVAIKLVSADESSDNKKRFAREVRVLSDLRHPGIVRYFAHGLTRDGQPYLAMEWLEGEDLKARITRQSLSVEECLELARRVAEALGEAHAQGVVHRDIKPSNLFLVGGDMQRLKVIDFGLARDRDAQGAHSETRTGVVIGTLGYMAPEQARGSLAVDARADVFSLGCVLWECLTGQPTFAGEHLMAVLAKILLEDARRVSELRDDIPDALDDLIARMLRKDPDERPADGRALLAELEALKDVEGESIGPRRLSLTSGEQRLVSVIVAGGGASFDGGWAGRTLVPAEAGATHKRLCAAVLPFEARLERLADGPSVATLAGRGSATDQAAQAARCALAMRRQLPEAVMVLATGQGVFDGLLPVGDVIDRAIGIFRARPRSSLPSYSAIDEGGSATKTTPRSQAGSQASPRPIHLDDVTRGLLDARFDVTGLELRGERPDVEAETRTLLGKVTPCVGREREFSVLSGLFDECVAQPVATAVLMTGVAGVGKSRVRQEFQRSAKLRVEDVDIWIARGDPIRAASPFWMIAELLRHAAGIVDGEPLDTRRRKVRACAARSMPAKDADLIAEFLGEIAGAPFPDEASPELREARKDVTRMGDRMRAAWAQFLGAECAFHPVLIILEDMHWGDLPSVQLIDASLEALRDQDRPLMVLALARPEIQERFPRLWAERGVVQIRLLELSRKSSERLVREVLGEAIPTEVVQRVVAQAEGNAFYLEELIRAVAEGKADALPGTVLAMVQARLSSLPPSARRVMRAGSIFGTVFWRGGVRALLGDAHPSTMGALPGAPQAGSQASPRSGAAPIPPTSDVTEWIAALESSELVVERPESRLPGEKEYTFRHSLMREGAYGMLTDADRALGHRLAGAWLEQAGEQDAMVLAEHFERGGERERANIFYQRAAEQALRANDLGELRLLEAEAQSVRGRYAEARSDAEEALTLLPRGSSPWYSAASHVAVSAFKLGDVDRLITLGEDLWALSSDEPGLAELCACSQASICLIQLGRRALAEALFSRLEQARAAPAASNPLVRASLHYCRAIRGSFEGEIRLDDLLAAAERYREAQSPGGDCAMQEHIGRARLKLGAVVEAEQTLRAAVATAERLGLAHVATSARSTLGLALLRRGAIDEARAVEEAAITSLSAQQDTRLEGTSRSYLAQILASSADREGAAREARAAVNMLPPSTPARAYALGVLSDLLLEDGHVQEALGAATEAKQIADALRGLDEGEALIRVVHAEALERAGDVEAARGAAGEARALLLARAEKIRDPSLRQSFLEGVPENARTLSLPKRLAG